MAIIRPVNILKANTSSAIATIFTVANAFVWFVVASGYLGKIVAEVKLPLLESALIAGASFFGIGVLSFIGSFAITKFQRRLTFLRYWTLVGIPLSLAPLIIDYGSFTILIITNAILGAYFGFGLPICLGYFSASTKIESRARKGALVFLLIGIGSFVINGLGGIDAYLTSLALGIWRATGLAVLLFLKPTERIVENKKLPSFRSLISNRSFLLYFIPWAMFALINNLTFPIYRNAFEALIENATIVANILAGVFGIFFGFFADSIGRKRIALLGFALLGIGYCALGFSTGNDYVFWFYTAVDGLAWGAISVIFIMTVWGDLVKGSGSEKIYVLGSLPYLFSNFGRLVMDNFIGTNVTIPAVFSFAGFFLFVAVLPLFYAPETLPEKQIRENELKSYLKKAKKEVLKAREKEDSNLEREEDKEEIKIGVNPEDLKETLKKAEKYY